MSYRVKDNIIRAVAAIILITAIFVFIFNRNTKFALLLLVILNCFNLLAMIILEISILSISTILYRRCDPERFLTVMLRNFPEKNRESRGLSVTYKIVRGLCAAGRFEEALTELNKIDYFPEGFFGEPKKRFYYEYLISIYIALDNIPQAEISLEALAKIAQDKDLSIVIEKPIKKQYEECALLLNIAKGRLEGPEEFLNGKFKSAKSNYERVFAKYYLGVVCSYLREKAKAREAFEYAAAHGNKLYIASQAAEKLKLIGSS